MRKATERCRTYSIPGKTAALVPSAEYSDVDHEDDDYCKSSTTYQNIIPRLETCVLFNPSIKSTKLLHAWWKQRVNDTTSRYMAVHVVSIQFSDGNRRRFSDEWIIPPGDVTTSGLTANWFIVLIVAHWIISTRAWVYDLASGVNSSDKLGTSRVAPPAERTVLKSVSSYHIWKIHVLKISG